MPHADAALCRVNTEDIKCDIIVKVILIYESKKNNFLMSGYLGSIGFALPAAIGAYMAVGDHRHRIFPGKYLLLPGVVH